MTPMIRKRTRKRKLPKKKGSMIWRKRRILLRERRKKNDMFYRLILVF